MRRIPTLLLLCLSVASLNSYSQDCYSTPPNAGVCSSNVAEDFNNGNGGFSSSDLSYSAGAFRRTLSGNGSNNTSIITSPVYFKTSTLPNAVVAGFTASAGDKVTITTVKLDIVNQAGTTVLASCTRTFNVNNTSSTICIGISSTALVEGLSFRYRFTISTTTGSGAGNREITFDNFSYGGNSNAPLPVNFVGFEGKKEATGVKLTWKVDIEDNVKGYDIEKSNDGRTYTSIGFVNAVGQSTYSFVDSKPQAMTYYRIKGVDVDGKYRYSPVVSMKNGKSSVVLKAFPMPANKSVTIQHSNAQAGSSISLYTESGVLVRSIKPVINAQQTVVDLSAAKAGLYMVRFDDGQGNLETIKIIKQ